MEKEHGGSGARETNLRDELAWSAALLDVQVEMDGHLPVSQRNAVLRQGSASRAIQQPGPARVAPLVAELNPPTRKHPFLSRLAQPAPEPVDARGGRLVSFDRRLAMRGSLAARGPVLA